MLEKSLPSEYYRSPEIFAKERERIFSRANLFLSLSPEHVTAFRLVPEAPDRTRIVCDFLFDPVEMERPGFDPSDAVDFWDLINRQDWAICEEVQRGLGFPRPPLRLLRADGGHEPGHPAVRARAAGRETPQPSARPTYFRDELRDPLERTGRTGCS